jgi:calcineurin-like phosphoesterase family protein
MNEAIIQNWNYAVKPNDTVYHLGDFTFSGRHSYLRGRLNGDIHLILGNHDKRFDKRLFGSVTPYKEIYLDDILICMMHYPMRSWNKKHYGAYHLHGHCHGSLPEIKDEYILDVGVDCYDFQPLHFDTIRALMDKKEYRQKFDNDRD